MRLALTVLALAIPVAATALLADIAADWLRYRVKPGQ
jgi:hypothetical protein